MAVDMPDWTTVVQSPQTLLANVAVAANATRNTDFVPPAGTHGVAVHLSGGSAAWSSIGLMGLDSGEFYQLNSPTNDQQVDYWFPLLAAAETGWRLQVIRSGAPAGAVNARIVALLDTMVVFVQNPGIPRLVVQLATGTSVDPKPYDGTATANNVAAAAVAQLAATPGKAWVARALSADIAQLVAGGGTQSVFLRDGLSGAGAIKWQHYLTTLAVGDQARFDLAGLAIKGTAGNAMTFEFGGAAAGQGENVNIGADLV